MSIAIGNIFGDMAPKKMKNKKVKVKDARKILREEEAQNLIDMDQVTDDALQNAEQNGIIFIDEIDKIASGSNLAPKKISYKKGVIITIIIAFFILQAWWIYGSGAEHSHLDERLRYYPGSDCSDLHR